MAQLRIPSMVWTVQTPDTTLYFATRKEARDQRRALKANKVDSRLLREFLSFVGSTVTR